MKVYCDTSVLVAASIAVHPHYVQSSALLEQIRTGKLDAVISTHGTAEFYAVLTRAPLTPPVFPNEALRIFESMLAYFHVASLSAAQYTSALREAAENGLTSNHCERIYTFNLRHFLQLAPQLHNIICSP
jgi:predicted nucleic acid-binding protein